MRNVRRFALGLLAAGALSCADAATITIVNLDAPGEGFNDTTVIDDDDGFAPGTTLGQKRLAVFQEAASIWAAKLQSNVEIRISARFDPLDCTSGSAILGSAGPGATAFGYPGLPFPNTDYAIATAEAISNQAILPPNQFQVIARFSSSIDTGCILGWRFWYGTQRYPNTLSNRILLLPLVMHELAHAFGFASFACISTTNCGSTPAGGYATGRLDAWSRFQADTGQGLYWSQMTNAQRATSLRTPNTLVWDGPNVNAALPIWNPSGISLTNGFMRLISYTQVNPATSVSHWPLEGTLRLSMMPYNNSVQAEVIRSTDLTDCVFKDIGWPITTTGCALGANQAPVVTAPASFAVVEGQTSPLYGIRVADPDSGSSTIEVRITPTGGVLQWRVTPFNLQPMFSGTSLVVSGRVEQLTNFLAAGGIAFTPSGPAGAVLVEANDLGRNGSGGPRIGSLQVPVVVQPVNDAPFLSGAFGPVNNLSLTEGLGPQEISYSTLVVNDDSGPNPIRLQVTATTGSVLGSSGAGVTVTGNDSSRTFVGPLAAINAYFAANLFRYTINDDMDANGTLTFLVDDQGHTGAGGPRTGTQVVNLNITTYNDPPSLQVPSSADFYAGGSTPVNTIVVGDPDARNGSMTLTVSVAAGYLVAGTPDGLVSFNGSGTPTLQIYGTRANINSFIAQNKLIYVNLSPTARNDTMQLRIDDNGNTGSTFTPFSATATIPLVANPIYSNGFE